MKILYFAWLRERLGVGEEFVSPPSAINTVEDLLDWLVERGPEFRAALHDRQVIRVAVNQEYAKLDHQLKRDDEIAFFPPVTGG